MTSPADNAKHFWQVGFRVFGLYGAGKDGKCACGWADCPALYKHPIAASWQHTPRWSEDQINVMEMTDQLATGFGVLCSGLLVIDVDARNGGVESYAALVEAVPAVTSAGLIVETGSGGGSKHLYFRIPGGQSLLHHLPDYPGIDFKSSGYVVGPGSMHASGNRYRIVYGSPDDIDDAPAELIDRLRQPERHRAEYDGKTVDVSHEDLADALSYVENAGTGQDYEVWIRCGMAVHHSSGGTAFDVWDKWSKQSDKYDAKVSQYKWHSFGRSSNPVTFGTLAHYAEQNGWKMSVDFVPQPAFALPDDEPERGDGLPFDITGIDLKRPPGFVGDLAAWIEAQSRRPRETLAVGAALVSMGNVASLRYTDDLDGVTTNLFTFCVAGSRTGKEAIQSAQEAIHKAAGLAPATHGTIKSEQEITRNLIHHQAAFYIIDEIGIFLRKVKNAQDKGGAIYLDGVIGLLMSAYSKANGFLLLSGDVRRDLEGILKKEAAALQKDIDENAKGSQYAARKLEQLKRALGSLDQGLEKPFVSVAGYTTPETFEGLMDFASATNGFIGRALIFNDRETAPKTKPAFRNGSGKQAMSLAMAETLAQLYGDGNYDMTAGSRIEHYGARRAIPTDKAAADMLQSVIDWFEDQAIAHKGKSGLEALYLGAYELVSKISLILAVPGGVRTRDHVRWAFALVRRDVEDKARLVIANDREKDSPQMALDAKILSLVTDGGETLGVIVNRLRKYRKADIEKSLAKMVEHGLITATVIPAARQQKPTIRYEAIE